MAFKYLIKLLGYKNDFERIKQFERQQVDNDTKTKETIDFIQGQIRNVQREAEKSFELRNVRYRDSAFNEAFRACTPGKHCVKLCIISLPWIPSVKNIFLRCL